jgi:LysR family hydrogen peroxide-inducible transcriptional activator
MLAMRSRDNEDAPMRNDLKLEALEQFVAIARLRNFTRAASELNISQSALSRSIQRLEEQLGQPVFERKPREVVLTDLGSVLLKRASEILKIVEDTFAELSDTGRRGRIRLGAIPTIAPYFLPGLLDGFAQAHPDIAIVVQEDTTAELARRCNHGDIDLAILALPLIVKYLEVEPLFEEELLLVLPSGHPLATEKAVTAASLDPYPFVMLSEAHCLAENVASFCRKKSIQPITVERTSQIATVQELVSLNHGISVIPEMARRTDSNPRRVYRSFTGEAPRRTIAMLWNPYRYRSQALTTFMDHLRRVSRPAAGAAVSAARQRRKTAQR